MAQSSVNSCRFGKMKPESAPGDRDYFSGSRPLGGGGSGQAISKRNLSASGCLFHFRSMPCRSEEKSSSHAQETNSSDRAPRRDHGLPDLGSGWAMERQKARAEGKNSGSSTRNRGFQHIRTRSSDVDGSGFD